MPKPKLPDEMKKSDIKLSLDKKIIDFLKQTGNASRTVEEAVRHWQKYLKRKMQ